MKTNKTTLAVLIAGCFGASLAMAEEDPKVLSPVVVTATRVEQDSFDLPMSIDKVEAKDIQDAQQRMNLAESLARVPGVTAPNRTLMSSDPQISSRGFGSRSTFGTRGVRVYVDGIPISNPDGLGNPGNVDLGIVDSIEVMRGPFSALYGNSSAGVIQLFTEKASATPVVGADFYTGSFGTYRSEAKTSGTQQGVEYLLDYSDYRSDGYREHSANNKSQATAKLGVSLSDDTKLSTLINWFDQTAQDPGGLTAAQVAANPAQSAPNNRTQNANARVDRGNKQVGFNLEKILDANNSLNFIVYGGQRFTYSNIATNVTSTSGRLSQIDRTFYGAEARLTNRGNFMAKPYVVTMGVTAGYMEDERRDTPTVSGVVSASSTRNELQKAKNFDQYIQGTWSVAERVDLHAGVRHTNVDQSVLDYLPNVAGNGTGSVSYAKSTPVVGLVLKAAPTLNFYANVGQGFETPTMIEVSFRDSSGNGPNLNLKPSTNTSIEVGAKWLATETTRINVAAFDISTENELIALNSGTYVYYGNASKTKRKGMELTLDNRWSSSISTFVAYSLLDAKFEQAFTGANGTVAAGNQIPGTYRQQLYGEVAFNHQPIGFQTAVEGRMNSSVFANDLNTATAKSYAIANVRASLTQQVGKWRVTEYARVENIFDKNYIGAVRVNGSNGVYYEPAAGRNYIVGVKANYLF